MVHYPIHVRHRGIHYDNIGLEFFRELDRLSAIWDFPDHFHILLFVNQDSQTTP